MLSFRSLAWAVFALGAALAGCRAPAEKPAAEVVLYCAADQEIAEPILAEFERTSGIKVLARYDSEAAKTVGLVQRIRSEAGRPAADVFWSGEVFHTIRLAREGHLAPYQSEATAAWPAGLADPQGLWHGFALRARVVCYHTGRVKPEEAPERLEDLLDPKWRGRVVMASPEFGTTSGHVAAWFAWYGKERAMKILEGLKANGLRLVAGNSTAVRLVANGEADLCLTDTDDVYAGRRNGWPVALKVLRHGDSGVLAIPNTAALVRGGPHPEAAAKLMAFLLSDTVERMHARSDSHNTPVHAAVAAEFPQYALPERLPVTYDKVADALPDAVLAAKILK